jgi:hypothetical protein
MLARQVPYHLSHATQPFLLSYFLNRVLYFARVGLDCSPPIYASNVAWMRNVCHHTQLLVAEIESLKLFARAGLEWHSFLPPDFCPK